MGGLWFHQKDEGVCLTLCSSAIDRFSKPPGAEWCWGAWVDAESHGHGRHDPDCSSGGGFAGCRLVWGRWKLDQYPSGPIAPSVPLAR